jgi:hypothetical protein
MLARLTPLAWDSSDSWKAKQSFFFRIRDSRNNAWRKCPISNPSDAIYGQSSFSQRFGNGSDVDVADCCNDNVDSCPNLGKSMAFMAF